MPTRLLLLLLGALLGACGTGDPDATRAEASYGAAVDASEALPAPAVAAEGRRYAGQALAVDGRIAGVQSGGCAVRLGASVGPVVVQAVPSDGACAWQVPNGTRGFAVAAGTLRASGDTLRLIANGVRVTPVRTAQPDSTRRP